VRFPIAALCFAGLVTPAQAADPATPVTIGREGPDLDACSAIGRVERLGAPPFDKLTVRERAEPTAAPTDRLARGTMVWLCDGQGDWQGVVYPSGPYQELGHCRVGSPVPEPRAYDGPCRQGWVVSRNVELVAG
jgi:hypothetical protein